MLHYILTIRSDNCTGYVTISWQYVLTIVPDTLLYPDDTFWQLYRILYYILTIRSDNFNWYFTIAWRYALTIVPDTLHAFPSASRELAKHLLKRNRLEHKLYKKDIKHTFSLTTQIFITNIHFTTIVFYCQNTSSVRLNFVQNKETRAKVSQPTRGQYFVTSNV